MYLIHFSILAAARTLFMNLKNLRALKGPILVTGHTGFKGMWLMLLLEKLGFEVYGFSQPPNPDSLYERIKLSRSFSEYFGDVRNFEGTLKVIANVKPSIIFHLAAQSIVLKSYKDPYETFSTNVAGTINVLEAARVSASPKIVAVVTSDKVYQNKETEIFFSEQDRIEGNEPYSSSKAATEMVVLGYQQVYDYYGGMLPISLRAGNVIGGGDLSEKRLIPDLIRALSTNKNLVIRNQNNIRPWQYVLDPLLGYIQATDKCLTDTSFKSFNFGPTNETITVKQVVDHAVSIWPKNLSEINFIHDNNAHYESSFLGLNSDLSKKHLGWAPLLTQTQSISATMIWWKKHILDGVPALDLCETEINNFCNSKKLFDCL